MIGNTQSDGAVFKTVLFYSVLILLLPIGCFFTTKSIIFETILGQVSLFSVKSFYMIVCQESTIGTNIVSAVVAVIVLHLALGLFIYKVCQSGIFSSVFTMFYRPTLTAARRESSRTKTNLHCVVASISETVIQ